MSKKPFETNSSRISGADMPLPLGKKPPTNSDTIQNLYMSDQRSCCGAKK